MRVKLSRFMTKGAPILMPASSSAAAAAYQQTKAKETKQRLYKGRPPQQPRPSTARRKASISSASVGSGSRSSKPTQQASSFTSDFALPHQPILPSPRQPGQPAAAAASAVPGKKVEAAAAAGEPGQQPTTSSVVYIDSKEGGGSIESQSSVGTRDRKESAVSVTTQSQD